MNKRLLKMALSVFGISVITGCTTVKVVALNNTGQEVMVRVQKYDDKGVLEASVLDKPIFDGKLETEVSSFFIGTKLRTLLYLKNGGMLIQSTDPVNWEPDPLIISLKVPPITLPKFDPQEPGTLLSRLSGDLGDIPMSGRKNSNLFGYLGGIYVKNGNIFERKISPFRLNEILKEANVKLEVNDGPKKSDVTSFQDSTQNDKISFESLDVKLPKLISGSLKVDFSTSGAYRHELRIENMGWYPSPVASNDLLSYLKRHDLGKEVISELIDMIKTYGKVYYMDSVYLIDKMDITTYESQALQIDTDIHAANFVDASGAFSWREAKDKHTSINNAILGARYIPLDIEGKKIISQDPQVIPEPPRMIGATVGDSQSK